MSLIYGIYMRIAITLVRLITPLSSVPHPDYQLDVPSRDSGRTIRVHVYRSGAENPRPVLINFHGSGFVIPWHGSDDEFARYIATETEYTVIDASYRLGPECPYPAAVSDVEDIIDWVFTRPTEFDASRVSLSGFSAGGNLALGASCSSPYPIRHVIAIYPPTDLYTNPADKRPPDASGTPIPTWLSNLFNNAYLPSGIHRNAPLVSPSFAPGEKFPSNVLIMTGARDSLANEAEDLAAKIKAVPGKFVVCERMEGCNHAWDKNYKPGSVEETAKNTAYELAAKMLNR